MNATQTSQTRPRANYSRAVKILVAVMCVSGNTLVAWTARSGEPTPTEIDSLLSWNCTGCHDSDSREGDLDLESLRFELDDPDNFRVWERVLDRVRDGEMPPDETLDNEDLNPFLARLQEVLEKSDASRIAQNGRVAARRLTRAQYERNVCELLSIQIPLRDYLPAEQMTHGFDTVSKSQQLSDHTMAAYLGGADAALDAAFNQLFANASTPTVRFDWTQLRRSEIRTNRMAEGRRKHQDIASWSTRQNFYGRLPATIVPVSGRYRIRLEVQAIHPPDDGRVWCSIQTGFINAKASTMYWVGSFEATSEIRQYEFEAWIRKGHMLRVLPNDRGLKQVPVKLVGKPAGTVEPLGFPGVAIKWIEMQRVVPQADTLRNALIGQLKLQRTETDTEVAADASQMIETTDIADGSADSVWVEGPDKRFENSVFSTHPMEIVSDNPERDLSELIHTFAQRAFRRPITRKETRSYLRFALERFEVDGSIGNALRAAYRAILCSPRFLYFDESPGSLDEYALANRLSHFLWGCGPDQILLQVAAAGRLSQPDVLRQQTNRLLADNRSGTFVHEFTDQWLKLYEINSTTPDGNLYPEYDDVLHHTLPTESHAFFKELVARNLPVSNIVDSDFTFLNSRLARHYNIAWPGGLGLQRVRLSSSSHRGGVITHASVLKVTANGTTTSPITRGVWMLERIMGQHVPPPPANVPAVEPDIRGATSIREELEKHKSIVSCAACHVKMDPPGFALENFDVIGGYRVNYRKLAEGANKKWVQGLPIDASHAFETGEAFQDVQGMRDILAMHPERLAKSLAMHLVTYSTGAAPTFADRKSLDGIVATTESSDYGVRSIVHAVIQSPLFRNK